MPRLLRFVLAASAALLSVSLPVDALTPGQDVVLLGARAHAAPSFPLSGALIDESFATVQYYPGPITSDLVDTRSTTKLVPNAAGILSTIAINALPITNAGMLVENAATNKFVQSQNFSAAGTNVGLTVGSTVTAPDNTNTAQSICQTTASSGHQIYQNGSSYAATGGTYLFSTYFSPNSSNFGMDLSDFGSNAAGATFNAATHSVNGTYTAGTGFAIVASGVQSSGNGFYRAYVVISKGTTANSGVGFWLQDGTGNTRYPSYVGTASHCLYLWGAQIEAQVSGTQNLPTSYIPTTTAAVTRAADSIAIQRSGLGTLAFTYSDNTTQNIYPNTGIQETLPLNLSETFITRMTGYAAQAPMRQAVATTIYPDTSTGSNAQAGAQQSVTFRQRCDTIQIAIPNSYGASETLTGGTLTATASLQYPIGTYTQFKFGGSTSGSTSGALLWSDEVPVPGGVPSGSLAYIMMWGSSSNSIFATADQYTQANSGVAQFGATVPDVTTGTGSLTNTTTGLMWQASAVICRHKGKAVGVIGDSIAYGVGASGTAASGAPDVNNLVATSLAPTLPVMSLAVPGDTANGFLSNHTVRLALLQYNSSFADEYGINDLNASRTAAQLEADRTSIAALLPGPVLDTTITPSATSTDGFATATNQTTLSYNPQRVIFNTWVRAKASYLETTIPLEYGLNSGIWRSVGDGSVTQATTATGSPWVGIHPTGYAYGLVKTYGGVNPALFQ